MLARTSEPPCFSVIAIPHSAPALSAAGTSRGSYDVGGEARLPLRRELGRRAQRRHARVGHRDRAQVPGLGLAHRHEHRGARDVRAGLRVASTAARAGRARPRPPSARARRGGTRPRRCGGRSGRACAGPAGSRSPAGPTRRPRRPRSRPPRGLRSAAQPPPSRSQRLDQRAVLLEDVVRLERRDLVDHLVRRPGAGALGSATAMRDHFTRMPPAYLYAFDAPSTEREEDSDSGYTVTFIRGDGTGPELAEATARVLEATGVEFEWDWQDAGVDVYEQEGTPMPDRVLESIRRNKLAMKAPITTPGRLRLPLGERRAAQGARPLLLPAPLQGLRGRAHAVPRDRHRDRAREPRGPVRGHRVRDGLGRGGGACARR